MEHSKGRLRQRYRAIRDSLTPDERYVRSANVIDRLLMLPEVTSAGSVFTYVSVGSEVETRQLIEQLWKQGVIVTVPSLAGNRLEPYQISRWTDVSVDRYGRCSPISGQPYRGPLDLNLVPGIVFDRAGNRIGSGYGHYDRFIAAHPGVSHIGLAFDLQILDQLPTESHDQPVNILVTESEVLRPSPTRR